jgi:hypothetical protein
MNSKSKIKLLCWTTLWMLACLLSVGAGQVIAAVPDTTSAATLRAKYAASGKLLGSNQFKRPLFLDSVETADHLTGDIYALVNYPFAVVNKAINDPAHWCDVLILHVNTKHCQASATQAGNVLSVRIGKKVFQPVDDAYPLEFTYLAANTTSEYFDIRLNAASGPLGTSDYRIRLEAVSVKGGKTFLHLTYSYAYDTVGDLAMKAYLATIGSGKVGFTNTASLSGGQTAYIEGVRGVVERNTMRYYLAIDAYLGALSAPPEKQLDIRLQRWFASTEQYARQLREVDRAGYMDMKKREYLRQQKPPSN